MVRTAFIEEALEIPSGVTVKVEGNNQITVKGPQGGPVIKDFSHARGIKISVEGNEIKFSAHFPRNITQALLGTITSIVKNLIAGVQSNYKYVCKVCYSHFPCNVEVKKNLNELHVVNFLGERSPRKCRIQPNVKVEINGDDVYLMGPDKEALGQTAANLKRCCRIRKKDPRVFQDGVYNYRIFHGDELLWEIK